MTRSRARRLPATACHQCGKTIDATTGATTNERPKAGDVSLCWHCGAFSIFTSPTEMRPATPDEAKAIEADPDIRRIRHAIAESYSPKQAVDMIPKGTRR